MSKVELSVEDEMDLVEAKFYPEAISYKAAKLVVAKATGLGDQSRAQVTMNVHEANINFLLDKWLDLRLELGETTMEVEYGIAA